jgi:hypothetical protein
MHYFRPDLTMPRNGVFDKSATASPGVWPPQLRFEAWKGELLPAIVAAARIPATSIFRGRSKGRPSVVEVAKRAQMRRTNARCDLRSRLRLRKIRVREGGDLFAQKEVIREGKVTQGGRDVFL